ncbi:MAG: DUF2250 domain-containing protein [Halobacteria archaeon]|nr:DUF2250 domain-containing protein [Halobacteria archaeon]
MIESTENGVLRVLSDPMRIASLAHVTDIGPDCARYIERRLLGVGTETPWKEIQEALHTLEDEGFVERVEGRTLKRDVPTSSVKHTLKRREQEKDTRMKHTYYEPTPRGEEVYEEVIGSFDFLPRETEAARLIYEDAEEIAGEMSQEIERRRHAESADLIYAHYSEVEEAIEEGRETVRLEGVEVEILPELSVDENAFRHYEKGSERE